MGNARMTFAPNAFQRPEGEVIQSLVTSPLLLLSVLRQVMTNKRTLAQPMMPLQQSLETCLLMTVMMKGTLMKVMMKDMLKRDMLRKDTLKKDTLKKVHEGYAEEGYAEEGYA